MADPTSDRYQKALQHDFVYQAAIRRERVRRLRTLYIKIVAGGLLAYVIFATIFPISACGCGGPNARRVSCESNMKQLGLALAQYAQDNDENLPPIRQPSGKGTWREALYPIVQGRSVYQCPDDKSDYSHTDSNNLPYSYGANAVDWNKHPTANPFIAVVDMKGYAGPEWSVTSSAFLAKTGRELHAHVPNHAFYQRPVGTINCLFTDGHVKALKPMATLTPVNLWTRNIAPFTGQELSNAQAILQYAEDE